MFYGRSVAQIVRVDACRYICINRRNALGAFNIKVRVLFPCVDSLTHMFICSYVHHKECHVEPRSGPCPKDVTQHAHIFLLSLIFNNAYNKNRIKYNKYIHTFTYFKHFQ